MPWKEWSVPEFVRSFQGVRLQQGGDARFEAVLAGNPLPEVFVTYLYSLFKNMFKFGGLFR